MCRVAWLGSRSLRSLLCLVALAACDADDLALPFSPLGDAGLDGGPGPTINIGYHPIDPHWVSATDAGLGVHSDDVDAGGRAGTTDDKARDLDAGLGDAASQANNGNVADARVCQLPKSFHWQASDALIAPKSPAGHDFVSIRDPTVVYWNNAFHVYATVYDRTAKGWNMVYLNFADWSQAKSAPQFYMANSPTHGGAAPQLFYFSPKKKWVLVYQWGTSYSTADDPSKPETWTAPAPLLNDAPAGAVDFWVICDDASCHLFFSNDKGQLYQAKMPVDQFPSAFGNAKLVLSDTVANLFGSSNVFKVKGTDKYLLLVEASAPSYFRSWTSTSLDGPWTPLAATKDQPFAGKANVSFSGAAWTDDISQGDMVRTHPDETMTIDACNLQFVFQGADPKANLGGDDSLTPYRLGVLTPSP